MHLSARFWSCMTYVTNLLTLSAVDQVGVQRPIGGHDVHARPETDEFVNARLAKQKEYLTFRPPSWRPLLRENSTETDPFECEYPTLKSTEWEFCSTATNRGCWIRSKNGSIVYNIDTDYETKFPPGKVRQIYLEVADGNVNADGMNFANGKLVNGSYPGPLIQACWGDTLNITVKNNLKWNGTAVHWHGIRQLNTMHMDGVPGITQCPIAPEDQFTYRWKALQYGTAWYHSHYSVQYADGLLGPLTIYGPYTANWDEGKYPILMNDWFHNSAYSVIHGKTPGYPTILLNGTGNISNYNYYESNKGYEASVPLKVNASLVPDFFRLHFDAVRPTNPRWRDPAPAKKYLLRLINSAFETGFVFSIDHHMLEVISADFVPIQPYNTTHLHIGIGQRYNVIVHAQPKAYPDGTLPGQRKLFWIRTTSSNCFNLDLPARLDYDRTGILSYYDEHGYDPKDVMPDTKKWPQIHGDEGCRDEDLENLVPYHEWTVGPPSNYDKNVHLHKPGDGSNDPIDGERLDVVGSFMFKDDQKPKFMPDFPAAKFSFERTSNYANTFEPMQIDYSEPIFLQLDHKGEWPKAWAVVDETEGKDGKINETSWIYLAMGGRHPLSPKSSKSKQGGDLDWTANGHPIHLHGHDFAILQQEENLPLNSTNIKIKGKMLQNPPRRDVALLPQDGFLVIAFKADNPGAWIMHCHIAFHASEGLAIQVMERQDDALKRWPSSDDSVIEAHRVCDNWNVFKNDCRKHWPGNITDFNCFPSCNNHPDPKQSKYGCKNLLYDDSGI